MGLFSNRSQKMSKCGKNICSDTLACGSCTTSLFSAHFDVICDLLLNRRTVTRNLFVNSTNLGLELPSLWSAPMYWELWLGPVLCSSTVNSLFCNRLFNNYSSSPNGPSASWAIDSEAMRARGTIVLVKSNYSRLSLNRHLYKTDTSVKRTPRVGPCLCLFPLFVSL